MDITVKHINNTYNYGSLMMAITLINRLYQEFDDDNGKLYIDTYDENKNINIARLIEETNFKNIYSVNDNIVNNKLKRYIIKFFKIIFNNRKDITIIIGGDDISEYYSIQGLYNSLDEIRHDLKFNKIFLIGQTIGPFTENREDIVRKILKKTKIYTRDDKCFHYVRKIGLENIFKGRDLAFLPLPRQEKSNKILDKYDLKDLKYITIVPSGLTKSYTDDYDIYIKEQVTIVEKVLTNNKLSKEKIVLLPHVLLPKHVDDRIVIKDIMKNLNCNFRAQIIPIYDEMLASEARAILGNGLFTITGRMHAAVSTFYMRKPAISLSYSVKYAGVIGEGLDMNELVVEAADNRLWQNGDISRVVAEKVDYVLDNYDELLKKIDIKVMETSKITEEQLDDLVKEIKKVKKL